MPGESEIRGGMVMDGYVVVAAENTGKERVCLEFVREKNSIFPVHLFVAVF